MSDENSHALTRGWVVQVTTRPDEQTAKPLPNRKDRRAAARDAARTLNRARKARG
jgi:hypothetical protein